MTHKIIKVENYLLVVDDSEIKEGSWYLTFTNNVVMGKPRRCEDSSYNFTHCKKIIAHLPLNNATFLERVDVLPPLEDDVEKMALEYSGDLEDRISNVSYDAYIKGYNKAREKYKYTKEDMWAMLITGKQLGLAVSASIINGSDKPNQEQYFNECIESRDPKTEWEMEIVDGKLKLKS